jgi:hypothetical protein
MFNTPGNGWQAAHWTRRYSGICSFEFFNHLNARALKRYR